MTFNAESLFSLTGKTVILTGASGFLGRTMSCALLENGARLVALGRSDRLRNELLAWKNEFGSDRVAFHQIDMYDLPVLEKTLRQITQDEARIDGLINNAHELGPNTGFNIPGGALSEASHDQWMRNLTGGVYWPALATQRIGPRMKAQQQGSIINISSMYAVVAPSPHLYAGTNFINPPGYSAAKAALLALTRYTASFWGADGIRANAILPGPFSNTQDRGPNSVSATDPFMERLKTRTCLGRVGRPEELVGAILFLASDASTFVTGHSLMVDGGWTIT